MSNTAFTESSVEQAALAWLEAIGWRIARDQGNGAALRATAERPRTIDGPRQQREARW
jgi:hypothetical protein